MTRQLICAATLLVLSGNGTAAQDLRGSQLEPHILLTEVNWSSDTTRVTYRVAVQPGSVEPLWRFVTASSGDEISVTTPEPAPYWYGFTHFGEHAVAGWTSLVVRFAVGDTTPELGMRAVGLPGVVNSWAHGWFWPDSITADNPNPTYPDPLGEGSVQQPTVGVEELPPDRSPGALTSRLQSLTVDVCGDLAWITDASICQSITASLQEIATAIASQDTSQALADLDSLLADFESWWGAASISDHAYWLLRTNGEIIRGKL